jgi:nucleoside-diphosphate-sugar epimerase
MKVVITGATSFLGVALCKAFQEAGHEVSAVCRASSGGLENLPKGVRVVHAELDEYAELPHSIPTADLFLHLAWAGTGHDGRDDVQVQKANVRCALQAMQAAHEMGCRLFVMAGSQAEYGSTDQPQEEEMVCMPFSEYGKAKLSVYETGAELAEQLGMKYLHLRIFSLFGENDHPWTLVMSCVDKMLRNEPIDLSSCAQNWNFLYVHDAARQIVRLCAYATGQEHFGQRIYNIASENSRPLKDFVERMKELTKSKSELHFGAIHPAHIVSLQPDISRLSKAIGMPVAPTDFDIVIQRIIDTHNDKTI